MPSPYREGVIIELLHNIAEALNGILDEPPGSNIIFPSPIPDLSGENIVEVPVDPNIAFAQLLRQARIQARKTQREIQEAMGLPNKTSYTRLERRGNPTLMTISKVLEVFPDFPLMEALGK